MTMQSENDRGLGKLTGSTLVVLALWFGIVMGLGEGALYLVMQGLAWVHWKVELYPVTERILWVAPLADVAVMLLTTVVILLGRRVWRGMGSLNVVLILFTFLVILNWGLVSGRLRLYGVAPFSLGVAVFVWQRLQGRESQFAGFCRRTLPLVILILAMTAGVVEGLPAWQKRRAEASLPAARAGSPNILFLVVDTLRADHLSVYGYHRQTSPHMERLAGQSILVERAYSAAPWTLPSHAAMLTGQYPSETNSAGERFEGRSRTLAEELGSHGYRTSAYSANMFWFIRQRGFGRGFLEFEDNFTTPQDALARTLWGRKATEFGLSRLMEGNFPGRQKAESIVHSILTAVDARGERPFFVMANFMDVHDPYLPPQPWRSRFSKKPKPGGLINELDERHKPNLTPEQLQDEVDAYDGAIAYVDEQIGRLLAALRERGLEQDTIVVLTSDHGEMLGEHGLYVHRNCLYLPVLHVPLILRWPGHLPEGTRLKTPVSTSSLAATLLELSGLPPHPDFRSPSFAALWKDGQEAAVAETPLSEMAQLPFASLQHTPAFHGALRSAIDEQWQYIESTKPQEELYNIQQDPQQDMNLADHPEAQEAMQRLRGRLQRRLGVPKASPAKSAP